MAAEVVLWIDYVSPYAFVAKAWAYELERDYDLSLTWRPYTLDVVSFMGEVAERDPHHWRRVRYAYMDARRYANKQGLTLMGPKRIYYARPASTGLLYAQKHGVFRAYNDLAFERFWRRAFDPEKIEEVEALLAEAGAPAGFAAFLAGEGGAEHDRLRNEAEASGVFGVPTFVFEGELFWGGDRIGLAARAAGREGRDASLGVRFVERAVDPLVQRLHLATSFARAILQQPLGAAKGVIHRELRIEEAIVSHGRMVDIKIDAAGQGHVDMDGKRTIQAVGHLYRDMAGRHAAIDVLECFDVRADELPDGLAGVTTLEADPQGSFHCALPFRSPLNVGHDGGVASPIRPERSAARRAGRCGASPCVGADCAPCRCLG